jgi:hypothetical protein
VNSAKNANVNSCGRKRKNRDTVAAQSRNVGTHTDGLADVRRIAAKRPYNAAPPTTHFSAMRPIGPAAAYAAHNARCARYSNVTHVADPDVYANGSGPLRLPRWMKSRPYAR